MATNQVALGEDFPLDFGEWLQRRRQALDLTQAELAERASCSIFTLRKIEAGDRRPSKQLAELFAQALDIPVEDQAIFIKVARGELNLERLAAPARASAHESQPTQTHQPVPGNLPRILTAFIGREPELVALNQLLCDPQCSLLTIVGAGGIGKTRLAIEAASQSKDLFPDGVWFVPLGSLTSPVQIVPAMAEALEFKFQDPSSLQAQLLRYLQAKRALLVLDNAEHLLEGGEVFTEILKACPQVKLLVTSRERLNLLSEWVFEIQGLPVPVSDQVEQFEAYSSVALFLQSARRVHSGFELREADRPWVRKICQIMEGMPLGIELSAAWVGLLSCEDIAQEIEHNLDFLSVSLRDLPARHRSLRATLDHSWQLLNPEERLILSRLSVFHGRFSRVAAQEICGASLAVLSSLRNKCLLDRTDREDYALHEIIRQYAGLRLAQNPDENEQVNDRHATYYIQCLANWEKALQSSQQLKTFNEMALVIDNLSQAWRHFMMSYRPESGRSSPFRAELLQSALSSLSLFYEMSRRSLEAISLLRESTEYLKTVQAEFEGTENDPQFHSVLGAIIAHLGLHHYNISQFQKMREYLVEAFHLLENGPSKVVFAQVQVLQALAFNEQGQVENTAALLEQSREVFREQGAKWWYALSTIYLGISAFNLGNPQESEALFLEAYQLVEPGDFRLGLSLRNNYAYVLNLKGDYDRAEQLLQENLRLSDLFGNYHNSASILLNLGRGALAAQRIEQAIQYIQKGIQILTEFEGTGTLALYRLHLGKCFAAQSDFKAARDQFQQVIKIGQESTRAHWAFFGLANIARIYFMQGRTEEALKISLALKHCPLENKRIQSDNDLLLADLQAALPKEQFEAAMKQIDDEILQDQTGAVALAYALELAGE